MIRLEQLNARQGDFALRDINLRVQPGDYGVLLGPPGSGKTSILELICGLRPLAGGQVVLGGRRVDGLDPADRQVGYVPQDYALFPTLGVFENIAFGLRVRRLPAAQIGRRVEQTAARLGISALLTRGCVGLSGGDRQRVALARALVLEPKVLLLDEPVAALDELTRQQVCLELRGLHDALGMTTLHVSHNLEETRSVADVVGVLRGGQLMQWGTADQVFGRPTSAFVARFVRAGNVLQGVAQTTGNGSGCRLALAGQTIEVPWKVPAGPAAVLLRPQDADLLAEAGPVPPGQAGLAATVMTLHDSGGREITVRVNVAGQVVVVALLQSESQPLPYRRGQHVIVTFDAARLRPLANDIPHQGDER